jgi:quercetin 2,3-dioxygenase
MIRISQISRGFFLKTLKKKPKTWPFFNLPNFTRLAGPDYGSFWREGIIVRTSLEEESSSLKCFKVIFRKRTSSERGEAKHGWLHARFTFSFADYYDEAHNGFHSLIVMNNDVIEPGGGFATHSHDNAEIFTFIISGRLEHKDSMGNGSTIQAGDLQYMSAGSGVTHSEFNPSVDEKTELYQIWMEPRERGGDPLYAEKKLAQGLAPNRLKLLFSGDGRDGSTKIRQEADFFLGQHDTDQTLTLTPDPKLPHAWIQVVSGKIQVQQTYLTKADGLAIENMDQPVKIRADVKSTFFLFRLPNKGE